MTNLPPDVGSENNDAVKRSTCQLLFVACLLLSLSGCSGCRSDRQPPAGDDPETKQAFLSGELQMLPGDDGLATYGVKPGHWFAIQQKMKSNQADFYGELNGFVGGRDRQVSKLARSPFQLATRQPVVLPKGQSKSLELTYFVPHTVGRLNQIWLYSDLRTSYQGSLQWPQSQVINRMEPYQNFFVVLANRPDSYGYIKSLESIRPPDEMAIFQPVKGDYVPVIPAAGGGAPLPSWSLMWTSVAYLIWDDFDTGRLSVAQQRAMVDWLHWGGQLIISGPQSLESLRASFLRDYLPADAGARVTLAPESIAEIDEYWSNGVEREGRDVHFPTKTPQPLEGVALELIAGADYVPHAGQLVAERRVGRGRVVVTSFSLTSRPILNWLSFDNFFNGCLLRKPARKFIPQGTDQARPVWADVDDVPNVRTQDEPKLVEMLDETDSAFGRERSQLHTAAEALLYSRIRYFSRDAAKSNRARLAELETEALDAEVALSAESKTSGAERAAAEIDVDEKPYEIAALFSKKPTDSAVADASTDATAPDLTTTVGLASPTFAEDGFRPSSYAGVGGWSDESDASRLARRALEKAAGIEVPDRTFILLALGAYLLVLVPLNWSIFRVIGKTEWAWAMVPLLAAIGTVAVVKLAQLDIGFARSRTEIAVVELQADYHRAHVTRYAGLYTSLSTEYTLNFGDESAVALPLATSSVRDSVQIGQREVYLQRSDEGDSKIQLGGLAVSSNSTGMIHSEQFIDVGGPLRIKKGVAGKLSIQNETRFDLLDSGAIRRRRGKLEFAWIGPMSQGKEHTLHFRPLTKGSLWQQWQQFGASANDHAKSFDLQPWLELAADEGRLQEGDIRLVSWSEGSLPGLTVSPAASQSTFRTFWVANLRYGQLPTPQSDENSPRDFDLVTPEFAGEEVDD